MEGPGRPVRSRESVVITTAIDNRFELSIGDLVLVDPVVGQLHSFERAAGNEHHAADGASDGTQPDRLRVDVGSAGGCCRSADFEPRLEWVEATFRDLPAQHAERHGDAVERRRANRQPLARPVVVGLEGQIRPRWIRRDRHRLARRSQHLLRVWVAGPALQRSPRHAPDIDETPGIHQPSDLRDSGNAISGHPACDGHPTRWPR